MRARKPLSWLESSTPGGAKAASGPGEATLALRLSLQAKEEEDAGWQQAWKGAGRQAGGIADKRVAHKGKEQERRLPRNGGRHQGQSVTATGFKFWVHLYSHKASRKAWCGRPRVQQGDLIKRTNGQGLSL